MSNEIPHIPTYFDELQADTRIITGESNVTIEDRFQILSKIKQTKEDVDLNGMIEFEEIEIENKQKKKNSKTSINLIKFKDFEIDKSYKGRKYVVGKNRIDKTLVR